MNGKSVSFDELPNFIGRKAIEQSLSARTPEEIVAWDRDLPKYQAVREALLENIRPEDSSVTKNSASRNQLSIIPLRNCSRNRS